MKKILLLFVGLAMLADVLARDVQVHVTDLRGTVLSHMRGKCQEKVFYTDEDGNFTVDLSEEGTYNFSLYDDEENWEWEYFDWDGSSPSVDVCVNSYYLTILLTGLSEEEMETYGNCGILIDGYTDDDASYFREGKLNIWYSHYNGIFKWTMKDAYWRDDVLNEYPLDTTTGPIMLNPKEGKHFVTLGSITGYNGQPIQNGRISYGLFLFSNEYSLETSGHWRPKGINVFWLKAPGYFPYLGIYEVGDEDMTLNVDVSDCIPVTLQVKDRDGSPLDGAVIVCDDTLGVTDNQGQCVVYYPRNSLIDDQTFLGLYYTVYPNQPFYPPWNCSISLEIVNEANQVLTTSYENYTLVGIRIVGGSHFMESSWSWGELVWDFYASLSLRYMDEYGNYVVNEGTADDTYDYLRFVYEQQGEDILVYTLVNNKEGLWQEACINMTTDKYNNKDIFPVKDMYAPLTDDIFIECNMPKVTLSAPEGFYLREYTLGRKDGQYSLSDGSGWGTPLGYTWYMPEGEYELGNVVINDMSDEHSYTWKKKYSFTVGSEDLTVVYPFDGTEESVYSVNLKIVNAPVEINEISYTIDGESVGDGKYIEGMHSYRITGLNTEKYGKVKMMSIDGTFNIVDQDVDVIVDLSSYRCFGISLRTEDEKYGDPFEDDLMDDLSIIDANGKSMYFFRDDYCLLPVGVYKVVDSRWHYDWEWDENDFMDNIIVKDYVLYGTLIVPEDCPENIVVVMSKDTNAVGEVLGSSNSMLSVIRLPDGLYVQADGNEPVSVRLYGINGNLLMDTNVESGTAIPVSLPGKGIYVVCLKQGDVVSTQKIHW